ncbi:MAG: hypothetical protein KJO08_07965 [Gammaproteobacteria bacterium]|nr:hypothetical protein [Gammaproteobacteria bacterium]
MSHIKQLIEQVISTAENRGISLTRLAQEAGMTAVELNTVRECGDIRAAALVALGTQVDLELTFAALENGARGQAREQLINDIKTGVFFHRGA